MIKLIVQCILRFRCALPGDIDTRCAPPLHNLCIRVELDVLQARPNYRIRGRGSMPKPTAHDQVWGVGVEINNR